MAKFLNSQMPYKMGNHNESLREGKGPPLPSSEQAPTLTLRFKPSPNYFRYVFHVHSETLPIIICAFPNEI